MSILIIPKSIKSIGSNRNNPFGKAKSSKGGNKSFLYFTSWNGIMPVTSPWITSQNSFDRKPSSLYWPIFFKGFQTIL